jgi:hypothetical protein
MGWLIGVAAIPFVLAFLFQLCLVHYAHMERKHKLQERDAQIREKLKPPDNVVPITKKLVDDIVTLEIERKINQ